MSCRNGISIIDVLLFQCVRSLSSSENSSAWPWAFAIVSGISDLDLIRSSIQALRDLLEKVLNHPDLSLIPILLPLAFHVDRIHQKNEYPLLSLLLEVWHFPFFRLRTFKQMVFPFLLCGLSSPVCP